MMRASSLAVVEGSSGILLDFWVERSNFLLRLRMKQQYRTRGDVFELMVGRLMFGEDYVLLDLKDSKIEALL